jgi:hypothetical protein
VDEKHIDSLDEDPVNTMVWYWAARCVMRFQLAYPQGDVTIWEDGDSYFDSANREELIEGPHDILISLAGLVGTGGWFYKEPPLTHTGHDMQDIRETLTLGYREHFFPLHPGVVSQDDAIRVYWRMAVELLLDPFAEWCQECLREELWIKHAMSGADIQRLLDDLKVRWMGPALPPIP